MALMKEHYNITRNRYDLINDEESKFTEKSLPGFIAHRHSQSVLSILAKKINCEFLSAYESEWAINESGVLSEILMESITGILIKKPS